MKPSSIAKAVGTLVAIITVSILSVGAIVVLFGGFYRGKKILGLGEEFEEDDALRKVSIKKLSLF